VVIRPLGNGLVMQQLYYPNEIRSIDEIDLGDTEVKENELKMAIQLAEMSASDEFHPENYRDEVRERIRGLIDKKIEGEEITGTEDEPKAQVIDLMEALRKSLGGGSSKPASKPAPTKLREVKAAPAKAVKEERKAPQRSASTVSARTASAKTRSR
jgi:DNA end-binding protein Ku